MRLPAPESLRSRSTSDTRRRSKSAWSEAVRGHSSRSYRRRAFRSLVTETLESRELLAADLFVRSSDDSGPLALPFGGPSTATTTLGGGLGGSSYLGDLVSRPATTSIVDWQFDTATGGDSRFDFADLDAPRQAGTTRELVIIDRATPDYQALVEDLLTSAAASRRFKLEWIDTHIDGVAAVGDLLARYSNLDAVHVVSHGRPGAVQLGNVVLSADNLNQYR
ncbi:MAG TPA: DUF4347 domain-containing protein, partial [Pirellulaceae bacterium]|nr:DUF4347 domain-containing protein [Pirellulaceae bacterium]